MSEHNMITLLIFIFLIGLASCLVRNKKWNTNFYLISILIAMSTMFFVAYVGTKRGKTGHGSTYYITKAEKQMISNSNTTYRFYLKGHRPINLVLYEGKRTNVFEIDKKPKNRLEIRHVKNKAEQKLDSTVTVKPVEIRSFSKWVPFKVNSTYSEQYTAVLYDDE